MTKKINSKERCDMLLTVFQQRTPKIPTFFRSKKLLLQQR